MLLDIRKLTVALRVFGFITLLIISVLGIIGSNEGTTLGRTATNTNYVVFLADKNTAGVTELYMYSLENGRVSKLNGPLVTGGNVTSFSISPDGSHVAYIADQIINERFELFVTTLDGIVRTKISNSTVNSNSDVLDDPVWAQDSSRVAYRSNESTRGNDVYVLRTARPNGTDNVIVNPQSTGAGSIEAYSFVWSPDGSQIAYLANQDDNNKIELYSSAANNVVDNVKVNGLLPTGGNVTEYAWSPDGLKIAYRADQNTDEAYELWVSASSGAQNTLLSAQNIDSDIQELSFSWSPDGSRIAYIADETIDEVFNLYTVLPNGSGRLQVNIDAIPLNGDVIGTPAWSPNGLRIAYVADLNFDEVFELFISLPNVANSGVQINEALLGGEVITGPYRGAPPAWSPNSNGIAYIAQQDGFGVDEVYVGSPTGSSSIKVSGVLSAANTVSLGDHRHVWAPDSSRLIYQSDQRSLGTQDLYTTVPTGSNNVARITGIPVQASSLKSFGKWAPDSSRIIYVSSQVSVDVDELYMTAPDGSSNQNISGPLVLGGDVDSAWFEWKP